MARIGNGAAIVIVLLGAAVCLLVAYESWTRLTSQPQPYRAVVEAKYARDLGANEGHAWLRYELLLRNGADKQFRVRVPQWVFNRVRPGDRIERDEEGRFAFPPSRSPRGLE